jgi:plastocyanin
VSQPGLVSVTGRATRGTTVALEPADGTEAPPPAGPVVMDQRGGQFLPGLLLARVGQPVEFRNGESINHNVYVTRGAAAAVELNVSTDPGEAYTHTFTRTGAYDVSCDIHPSMRASLVVVDTPWSAIGDDFGRFVIMNVPPGRYRLMTIPAGSAETRTVEIGGDHVDLGAL